MLSSVLKHSTAMSFLQKGKKIMSGSVDVIIPCRNAPEVLSLCLTHYWANAHDNNLVASVTLLDNCSTAPGMDEVLGEATRRGCVVIRHEWNIGVWASVNRGLALARSEFVLVLTSDVLLGPMAIELLLHVRQQELSKGLRILGPIVRDGLVALPWLSERSAVSPVNYDHYNGACWLMDRALLTEDDHFGIGWFDPRFYVCFGDVDYMQRVRDGGHTYGVTPMVRCVHLNQQSRQADHTVDQDNVVEVQDAERFHEKWRNRPDVLARHPIPNRMGYALMKDQYWRKELIGAVR